MKTITNLNQLKKHKYNAKKTVVDGIKFDSLSEAKYYQMLKRQMELGGIKNFSRQVKFELQGKYKHPYSGKIVRSINLIIDFVVTYNDDRTELVDVKGMMTDVFKIKAKMLMKRTGMSLVIAKYDKRTKSFKHTIFGVKNNDHNNN